MKTFSTAEKKANPSRIARTGGGADAGPKIISPGDFEQTFQGLSRQFDEDRTEAVWGFPFSRSESLILAK